MYAFFHVYGAVLQCRHSIISNLNVKKKRDVPLYNITQVLHVISFRFLTVSKILIFFFNSQLNIFFTSLLCLFHEVSNECVMILFLEGKIIIKVNGQLFYFVSKNYACFRFY